jgi:hypothetical protein
MKYKVDMIKLMKLWCCAALCLFSGLVCWADDQPPSDLAKPSSEVAPAADPIGVHPLFGAAVPEGEYTPLTEKQRLQLYLRQTFTTANPWLRTAISSGIAQMQGRQYSWGGGVEGYSRRYSSQYATYVIRNSFLSLGAWGLGHDTRYVPSKSHNAFSRIGHAVLQNVLTVNREGNTTVNVSRILSGYGAGMIATNWQPHSKWSAQGIRAGNEQLIYGGVFNIGREFAPEVDHLMKRIFHPSRGLDHTHI